MGRQNTEGGKVFVTLFSYIVWLSAMKFVTLRGIGAQQVNYYFGELWFTFPRAHIFDSRYFARFLTESNEICQRWPIDSKFRRVSQLGFVTAPTSLDGGQPNFARCLAASWAGTLYTFSGALVP